MQVRPTLPVAIAKRDEILNEALELVAFIRDPVTGWVSVSMPSRMELVSLWNAWKLPGEPSTEFFRDLVKLAMVRLRKLEAEPFVSAQQKAIAALRVRNTRPRL